MRSIVREGSACVGSFGEIVKLVVDPSKPDKPPYDPWKQHTTHRRLGQRPARLGAQRVEHAVERVVGTPQHGRRGLHGTLRFDHLDQRLDELDRLGPLRRRRGDLLGSLVQPPQIRLNPVKSCRIDAGNLVHAARDGRFHENFSPTGNKHRL